MNGEDGSASLGDVVAEIDDLIKTLKENVVWIDRRTGQVVTRPSRENED